MTPSFKTVFNPVVFTVYVPSYTLAVSCGRMNRTACVSWVFLSVLKAILEMLTKDHNSQALF